MRLLCTVSLLFVPLVSAEAQFVPRNPPTPDRLPGIVDQGSRPADAPVAYDLKETRSRIAQARDSGDLSKRDARLLRRETRQIGALADRYGRDGLSDSERRELDTRVRILQSQTEAQRLRGRAAKQH